MQGKTVVWWVCAALVLVAAMRGFGFWLDRTELPDLNPEISVVVEDRRGTLLRGFTVGDGLWRLPVDVVEVSPNYIQQLIAFEDKRFYRHGGVDLRAMLRAVGQAVWHGEVVSGGSTLTMQVARLLENSGTGAWRGKLRQMRVAWALERYASKDEILQLYLQLAPFGGNLEGVRAASLSYFQKEPKRLTDAQAALLVALPQSPERRRPDRFADRARTARDRVLDRGAQAGVLSAQDVAAAKREAMPEQKYSFAFLAPHLSEQVLAKDRHSLRHRLTLDHEVQRRAEALAVAAVRGRHGAMSAAVLVAEIATGDVLASVGSPDYLDAARQGFVDMTQAVRSPGSTLKPLIYGLAFDAGRAHPETIIDDGPARYGPYAPQNFDNHFRGEVSLRHALQDSLNTPAVALLDAVGPSVLMGRMERAGARPALPNRAPPGLAIGLGGVGLSLRDLVTIYAGIANRGRAVRLRHRLADPKSPLNTPPILSEVAAWYVADVLSGIAPPKGAGHKGLAYKTGTSYGHRDAWAIGFDGRHVVGVWLGRADGAAMPGALGAELAAPLLFDVFGAFKQHLDPLPPAPRDALVVSNGALPLSLQRFFGRHGDPLAAGPEIAFPPNGARVFIGGETHFVAKVENGVAPFTWLVNGVPQDVAQYERQSVLPSPGQGHVALSVIDANGRSARSRVYLE